MTEPVTWEVRARILRPLDGVVGATVDVLRPDGIRTTGAGGATEVDVVHGRGDVLAQEVEAVAVGMMRDLDPAARDQFARLALALARGVKRATVCTTVVQTPDAGRQPMRERLAWWLKTMAPAIVTGAADPGEVVDALLDVLSDPLPLHVPTNAAASRTMLNPGGAAWAAGLEAIRAGA